MDNAAALQATKKAEAEEAAAAARTKAADAEAEAARLTLAAANAPAASASASTAEAEASNMMCLTAKLAALIDPEKAMASPAEASEAVHKETIYLTVVDRDLTKVSLIYSIFHGFGSGMASDKFGVLFQNRGAGFVLTDGHVNEAAGGKRPLADSGGAADVAAKQLVQAALRAESEDNISAAVLLLHHSTVPSAAPRSAARLAIEAAARRANTLFDCPTDAIRARPATKFDCHVVEAAGTCRDTDAASARLH